MGLSERGRKDSKDCASIRSSNCGQTCPSAYQNEVSVSHHDGAYWTNRELMLCDVIIVGSNVTRRATAFSVFDPSPVASILMSHDYDPCDFKVETV